MAKGIALDSTSTTFYSEDTLFGLFRCLITNVLQSYQVHHYCFIFFEFVDEKFLFLFSMDFDENSQRDR
jgi:hypothetical protein